MSTATGTGASWLYVVECPNCGDPVAAHDDERVTNHQLPDALNGCAKCACPLTQLQVRRAIAVAAAIIFARNFDDEKGEPNQ